MYKRILVALEHSPYDNVILEHVRALARHCGATVMLIHVADGWVARNMKELELKESKEMREDAAYLAATNRALRAEGFTTDAILAAGDPANEIVAAAEREHCDLIAMATHGHRGLDDLVRGSVASEVRHRTMVPVLLVRGPAKT